MFLSLFHFLKQFLITHYCNDICILIYTNCADPYSLIQCKFSDFPIVHQILPFPEFIVERKMSGCWVFPGLSDARNFKMQKHKH